MFYKNARIFTADHTFRMGTFEVTDEGLFGQILPDTVPENAVDLEGATVIPGLVDVHIHGSMGGDFSDGDYAGLEAMAQYLLQEGITSFAPASMTLPYPQQSIRLRRRYGREIPCRLFPSDGHSHGRPLLL